MSDDFPVTSLKPPDQSSFYSPLQSQHSFRLLHFPNVKNEGPLECYLGEHDIRQGLEYRALSYTWERPYYETPTSGSSPSSYIQFNDYIKCNGRQFFVTRNAWEAINALVKNLQIEYLWVDAICINQDDTHTERPQQISMMANIYEGAQEVLIWLGHYTDESNALLWAATTFVESIKKMISTHGLEYVLEHSIQDPTLIGQLGGPETLRQLRDAMKFYENCRIFDRAWVVQEYANAKIPRLFCGTIEFPSYNMGDLGVVFGKTNWGPSIALANNEPSTGKIFCGVWNTWNMLHGNSVHYVGHRATKERRAGVEAVHYTTTQIQKAFVWLLIGVFYVSSLKASDPRDNIFTAFGFGKSGGIEIVQCIPKPNYSSPVLDVYTEFATAMINNLPKTRLFWYLDVSANRLHATSPSWVPTMDCQHFATNISSAPSKQCMGRRCVTQRFPYRETYHRYNAV